MSQPIECPYCEEEILVEVCDLGFVGTNEVDYECDKCGEPFVIVAETVFAGRRLFECEKAENR